MKKIDKQKLTRIMETMIIGGIVAIISLGIIWWVAYSNADMMYQKDIENENLSITLQNLTSEYTLVKDWCRTTIAGYENNITLCPACAECNDTIGTYLTFKQYQDMSIRIKWLERRLVEINNTDYIEELEDNLTTFINNFNICNNTLEMIKNATN